MEDKASLDKYGDQDPVKVEKIMSTIELSRENAIIQTGECHLKSDFVAFSHNDLLIFHSNPCSLTENLSGLIAVSFRQKGERRLEKISQFSFSILPLSHYLLARSTLVTIMEPFQTRL